MVEGKSVGDYVYDKFLGEGSFGKVYKGKHKSTGEIVAIKCMDMAKLSDPYMLNSLKTEIKVMQGLKSENIVKMYDVIHEPKTTYIILELCADGDLDKYIQKNGGMLQEKAAIEVLKQLMHGFQELVSHNYIHRDIKPANALVKGSIFKVADFGFACEADIKGKTLIKECVGTPLFMAPQLLENKPYSAKSDIWSIGMMFYMMIFGNTPWPCRDLYSFLSNIKRQPLRFPYNKPISKDTKDFIKRSLTVDESQRIGWTEVFSHPLIQCDHSNQQVEIAPVQLDKRSTEILQKMQEIVRNHKLDVKQIFNNFDKDKGGNLDQQEFYKMMAVIDPRITYSESSHIFQQVDSGGDGNVSFKEFESIFNEFDFNDVNDRAGRIIIDLKEIVKANNLPLKQIFQKFDADQVNKFKQCLQQGTLNIQEFTKLIKIIAPGLKDHEVQDVYKRFDANNDGAISFKEFYRTMVYGIEGQDTKYDPQKEKAEKVISELKRVVKQHNLNVLDIFKNFDKSGDGKLDLNEFTKLVQVIDKSCHSQDVIQVFKLFTGQANEITFMEFYQHLN